MEKLHFWLSISLLVLMLGSSHGQPVKGTSIDSLAVVLQSCTALDSLRIITQLSEQLPYDSSKYGLQIVEAALQSAARAQEKEFESQLLFYRGMFQERAGQLDSAKSSYESSMALAEQQDDEALMIKFKLGVALVNQKKGSYQLAERWLDTLRDISARYLSKDTDHLSVHLKVLDITGDNHYFQGQYDEASTWYTVVADEAAKAGQQSHLANAYKGLSAIYGSTGRLYESVDYAHKALTIFESLEDINQVSLTLIELGRVYKNLKLYDKALEFYQRALEIKQARGDRVGMTVVYQNIGVIHSRQKNYGLALEYYEKSRDLKNELGIARGMAALSINMGLIHKRLSEYPEAEEFYFDALQRAEAIGSATNRTTALQNLCSLYLSWSKFGEARKYGHMALDAAKAQRSLSGLSTAYYNLHEAYLGLGDYKNAYDLFVITVQYDDSLAQQSKASEIQRIENEYSREKEERQIELSEQQLALLEAEERLASNEKTMLIAAAAVIIIALVLLLRYVILRSRRERSAMAYERDKLSLESKLTTQQLEFQKLQNDHDRLQLSVLSKELVEKNDQLSQLEDDLDRLTKDYIADEAKERKGLAETVLSHGRNGEEWARFMQYFRNVYHDYLDRLKSDHSEITSNELRLCALIKINLSTKEIASALNITPESLRTAKYRLRKKLHLKNDDKLTDYLLRH